MSDEMPLWPEESNDDEKVEAEEQPIDVLNRAVQEFANSQVDEHMEPGLVKHAIVVWEETAWTADGQNMSRIRYTNGTDTWSLSASLGLLEAAREYVRRDVLGDR
jgi:hypothetical protein